MVFRCVTEEKGWGLVFYINYFLGVGRVNKLVSEAERRGRNYDPNGTVRVKI